MPAKTVRKRFWFCGNNNAGMVASSAVLLSESDSLPSAIRREGKAGPTIPQRVFQPAYYDRRERKP